MVRALRRLIDRIALRDKQYRLLFRDQESNEARSLDCDTTGVEAWSDEIVSVAAIPVRRRRSRTIEDYRAALRPTAAINERSIRVQQLLEKHVQSRRPVRYV